MRGKDIGWWTDFFPTFRVAFDIIPQRVTNAQVRYVIDKLNLAKGKKFLDCPCGIGRIAIPLARKGIKVTGVDITTSYLDELADRAQKGNINIELVNCDMRRISFNSKFDAAANIWTSFGFFEKDSDNMLVLKRLCDALKPGGRFLLHVVNRDWVVANFKARGWYWAKNTKIVEERNFDYSKSINYCTWYFIEDGEEKIFNISIRMYSYHEIIAMFKKAGFIDIEGFSTVNDDPVSRDNQMMFIFGTRPR
jgi:ubiquinone/menaquinone biosynthesis C-methylase UbiE